MNVQAPRDFLDRRQLLGALRSFRRGDFTVRLSEDLPGEDGEIARLFNETVSLNEQMTEELERLSQVVGKEGKISQRGRVKAATGGWESAIRSVNELIEDMVQPTAEVARVIGAVAKGDLSQSMTVEIDGRPLRGEFLRIGKIVNTMVEQLASFASEVEARPSLWVDRLHPDDRDRALAAIDDRRRTGAMAIEYRWQCADGRYKHFLDQAVLLRAADGAAAQFAGTLLDVTDRKDLEKQLLQARKMDAIGKLTGGIAHDFNNLLAAVLGGLGMIERRLPLEEEHKKIIGMTRRAAEQGSELVKRLLAFARRQTLQPDAIDIARLSATVNDLLAHTLGGLAQLEWRSDKAVWCAYADSTQLELALMNLIINARDAMPKGGTIAVAARNAQVGSNDPLGLPPGDYVVLAVTDDGSGIPAAILEQVTEPFFTTKAVGKGTGLGLSMVYGFAHQSGGAIEIDSQEGEGTTVAIWLPRAPAPKAPSDERATPAPEAPAEGQPLRILLVDDHDAVRETTAGMLSDMGHRVETASDGPGLLSKLSAAPADYDLIITDYAMPLLSGADVLKQAREIRPGMPGIIISGYADSRSIARPASESVVLTKPFTLDQMKRAIGAVSNGTREPLAL